MLVEEKIYKDIVSREKESRKEAERLLEKKSHELYIRNRQLVEYQEKLEASNNLLSQIMSAVPDCIIATDHEFNVINFNLPTEYLFGYTEYQIGNMKIDDLVPNVISMISSEQDGQVFVMTGVREGGSEFPVEVKYSYGTENSNFDMLFVIHDVTKRTQLEKRRKEIEEQMNEVRHLEAIGTLSAGIAHEINTPMQFISDNLEYLGHAYEKASTAFQQVVTANTQKNNAEISIETHDADKEFQRISSSIRSAISESVTGADQIRDIVFLIREFSHPGTDGSEEADLNAILNNVVQLCHSRYKLFTNVDLDLEEGLPLPVCRKGQVQQVFLNLFINAVDAVESTVTSSEERGRVRISSHRRGNDVVVTISDTGAGIPDQLKEKIFHPFFTTKSVGKGTGQGLALAKDIIVVGHGGSISLTDIEGFQTSFQITIPISSKGVM